MVANASGVWSTYEPSADLSLLGGLMYMVLLGRMDTSRIPSANADYEESCFYFTKSEKFKIINGEGVNNTLP